MLFTLQMCGCFAGCDLVQTGLKTMSRIYQRALSVLTAVMLLVSLVHFAQGGIFGPSTDENAPPKPSAAAFDHANAYVSGSLNNNSFNSSYRAAPANNATSTANGYSGNGYSGNGYSGATYQPAGARAAGYTARSDAAQSQGSPSQAAFNRPPAANFPVSNAGFNARSSTANRGVANADYNQPVGGNQPAPSGQNLLPADFLSPGAAINSARRDSAVSPAGYSRPAPGSLNSGDYYGDGSTGLNQNNGTLAGDVNQSSNNRPTDDGGSADNSSSIRTANLPEGYVLEGDTTGESYSSDSSNLRPTEPATAADFGETPYTESASAISNGNRLPEIFGDFYSTFGSVQSTIGGAGFNSDLPLAGGSRRVKIAEHNKPMPDSRYYFLYHNFNNAMDAGGPGGSQSQSVDRYTVGFEHSLLFGGNHSIEVRAPFTSEYAFNQGAFNVAGGEIGNVAVIWKSLLAGGDNWSISGGAGVDTPTGEDVTGAGGGTQFRLSNSSVHILPFIGFELRPSDRFFYQGFLQGDFATNGNTFSAGGASGTFDEQHLLHLDFATGMWLMRDYDAQFLTGLALMGEFHYTTTFENSDVVALNSGGNTFRLSNPANRFDTLNAVIGVHAEVSRHIAIRAGWAFPLADKEFSNEITASVIWYH